MNDTFITRGRPRRKAREITNLHHYQVELFYVVIDMQLQELNSGSTEVNTELLLCVPCLNPCDSFIAFDKKKVTPTCPILSIRFFSNRVDDS